MVSTHEPLTSLCYIIPVKTHGPGMDHFNVIHYCVSYLDVLTRYLHCNNSLTDSVMELSRVIVAGGKEQGYHILDTCLMHWPIRLLLSSYISHNSENGFN